MIDPGPTEPSRPSESLSRFGYVALAGAPNVGKSTLLNRLVGRQLSITARRPQTTRRRILGILNGPGYQAVLVDTPGLLEPKYQLQAVMRQEADRALREADVVLLMFDATRPQETDAAALAAGRPALLAINKIDLVPRERLLAMVAGLADRTAGRVYLVSALKGDGVGDLRDGLVAALPPGPACYPPDMVTDRPERFFASELVREAVFQQYGDELPYSTAVVVEEFAERPGRKDYIRAVIYVERVSQRKIIIGRAGAALKRVGATARHRIEEFLGRPVYLELWVKVAEGWRRNERFIRDELYREG
ncbi:MAG: GTPase Era [bacterium]